MFKFKLTKPINISNRIQITLTYNSNYTEKLHTVYLHLYKPML